jgi:hypothetical protein
MSLRILQSPLNSHFREGLADSRDVSAILSMGKEIVMAKTDGSLQIHIPDRNYPGEIIPWIRQYYVVPLEVPFLTPKFFLPPPPANRQPPPHPAACPIPPTLPSPPPWSLTFFPCLQLFRSLSHVGQTLHARAKRKRSKGNRESQKFCLCRPNLCGNASWNMSQGVLQPM